MHWDTYIAHAWEDKPFAQRVSDELKKLGIKVWYDVDQIKSSQIILEKMNEGLVGSFKPLVIASQAFLSNTSYASIEGYAIENALIKGEKEAILILTDTRISDVRKRWPTMAIRLFIDANTMSIDELVQLIVNELGHDFDPKRGAVILSPADDIMPDYMDFAEFEESLYMTLLFHRKVVFHETSPFNSRYLRHHFQSENQHKGISLFEQAVATGVAIPAFRNAMVSSMQECHDNIKHLDGIIDQYDDIDIDTKRLLSNIDRSLAKNSAIYWPPSDGPKGSSGECYERKMRQMLQGDLPFSEHQMSRNGVELESIWKLTKDWRHDVLDETVDAAEKGAGLPRGSLFVRLAKHIGAPSDFRGVRLSDIRQFVKDDDVNALTHFIRWASQIHFLNQSDYFDVAANLAVHSIDHDFVAQKGMNFESGTLDPVTFHCRIPFPGAANLKKVSPLELMAVRNDLGVHYFDILEKWATNPTDKNKSELQQALLHYSQSLCKYSQQRATELDATIISNPSPTSVESVASELMAGDVGSNQLGIHVGATDSAQVVYSFESNLADRDFDITLPRRSF